MQRLHAEREQRRRLAAEHKAARSIQVGLATNLPSWPNPGAPALPALGLELICSAIQAYWRGRKSRGQLADSLRAAWQAQHGADGSLNTK